MQVDELARDLKVDTAALLHLLREMGIHASDADSSLPDAAVARVLARIERERRSGKDVAEALQAALEEASSGPRRRRRRRAPRSEEPEEAAPEEADEVEPAAESDEEAPEAEPIAEVETAEEEPEPEVIEAEAEEPEEAPRPEAEEPEPVAVADEVDEAEAEPEVEAPEEPAAESEPATADEPSEPVDAVDAAPVASPDESGVASEADAADEESSTPAAARPEPARRNAPDGPVRVLRKPTPAASAGPGGTVRIQAEGYTTDGRRKKKDKKKRRGRVDQDAVQENLQRVMAEIKGGPGGGGKKKRRRGGRPSREEIELQEMEQQEEQEREAKTVKVNEFLTIAELAELMDVPAAQIVGSAFKNLSLMVTINQRLDFDQIEMLLDEFGFVAVREEDYAASEVEEVEDDDDPADLKPRPPVVTVMGHVDHGKTLLLDRIRKSNVVAGEAGGITQHIGAYHVELEDGRSISFLDTPGHAAFTAMRARGADITDIVILIVAADDSVMPQTIEAISHAKNAGVPMIVAVNKVDLPAANPGKVKQELLQHDVQVEDYGGQVLAAEISAKTGQGIDDLLEKVLLQAELLELTANPDRAAHGAVIEAQLDVGKGPVVTVLIQKGTLRVGDDFLCGIYDGRVRAMLDERGKQVKEAGPGMPVQILGSGGVPQAGDAFQAMDADRAAEIAANRQRLDREKQLRIKERGIKLGDFSALMADGQVGTLPLIIKGDVDGSVQAVSDALEQLGTSEVQVEIIHRAVGAINESDILLAETAGAVVIGFRVRPDTGARQLAERSGVDIQTYDVIYNAVDDVRSALEGMLSPEQKETILGTAEVREVFKITRVGTIAGCYVTEGTIERKARARLVRDGIVQYDGEFSSLKRFKDDVREVREGFECGIGIANYNDIKVGDVIECFRVEEVARTLASSS
ncbi:translation initiation factor IF-2 [Gaopeijia maritima]|uniref:Translation initiation factor IF-2 n=1 Tax=Gaopeijia maritima TaxID=3119007 RepID=A0ABU9EBT6_9BACT